MPRRLPHREAVALIQFRYFGSRARHVNLLDKGICSNHSDEIALNRSDEIALAVKSVCRGLPARYALLSPAYALLGVY